MKVLFTGKYDPNYNRTLVIKQGLRANGIKVIEFPFDKLNASDKSKLIDLSNDCDVIFLPSFTHYDVVSVKKILPHKKLIFDPLISKYLTKVFDYKTIYKWSPRALKNWWKDTSAMQKADIVLADTAAHKKYFHETFNIPLKKIKVLYIGVDTSSFYPIKKFSNPSNLPTKGTQAGLSNLSTVGFYGSFAPLQGIDKIIQAAKILENEEIKFEIVGGGFTEKKIKKLAADLKLKNILFTPTLPFEKLNAKINSWDICLGIFGDSLKSDIVIPNKIYHYAACEKPIITKESPAILELFQPDINIYLCKNTPEELAKCILQVVNNTNKKRDLIAQKGFELITQEYNEERIGRRIMEIIGGGY